MKSLNPAQQKTVWLSVLIAAFTILLPVLSHTLPNEEILPGIPPGISRQMIYQLITLALAIVLLIALYKTRPAVFKAYFKKGQINAEVVPAPRAGIKPKKGQNWKHTGWNFAIVISVITGVVIYFSTPEINFPQLLKFLPYAVAFALVNAFVEEMITRLGVIVALKDMMPDHRIALISGGLFGFVHYWGTPGGFGGVLLAGFLGWLLAKSILETRGIFWAWLIHFFQDVIIISAMFGSM
jgi:membrane protease YdiL (CAAX protease family)